MVTPSELRWTNKAGVSWPIASVTRTSAYGGTAVFPDGAPYAGTPVTLRIDPGTGVILAFTGAGGEEYIHVGAPAGPEAASHPALALASGRYERQPVGNDWHVGILSVVSQTELRWTNNAGAAWPFTGVTRTSASAGTAVFPDGAPYAGTRATLRIDPGSGIIASFIGAGGEEYVRVGPAAAAAAAAAPAAAASSAAHVSASSLLAPVSLLMSRPEPTEATGQFEAAEAAAEAAAAVEPFDGDQPLRLGRYERAPVENGWHAGTLSEGAAPGTLRWANDAGAAWDIDVTRTCATRGRGVFVPGAPYAGTVARLVIGRDDGAVVSFTGAGGELFSRVADEDGAPVAAAPTAGATTGALPELPGGLHGYVSMQTPPAPPGFSVGAGFYVPCWPLTAQTHRRFQIGLPGMWVTPDNSAVTHSLLPRGTQARDNWPECGPTWRDHFQTIEGSMGWWTSTRFNTTTPKYALNGTGDGYTLMLSSPGWSFTTEPLPPAKMGVVQLSNRLLVVPDGMPFRPGTCGPLFGTTWASLPLGIAVPAAAAGDSEAPPTGEAAWTLFLASATFKGPVAFWLPQYWSAIGRGYPPAHGRTLCTRPCKAAGGAMEAAETTCFVAHVGDADGDGSGSGGAGGAVATPAGGADGCPPGRTFVRVPQLRFPVQVDAASGRGWSDMMVDFVQVGEAALAARVRAWLDGHAGAFPSGTFALEGIHAPACDASGDGLGFDVAAGGSEAARRKVAGLEGVVRRMRRPGCAAGNSYGLQWSAEAVAAGAAGGLIALPDTFMRAPAAAVGGSCSGDSTKDVFLPVPRAAAPPALLEASFARKLPREAAGAAGDYRSPSDPDSCWRSPGPSAGPFTARLADGSLAEYCWYRFEEQPTLVARRGEVPPASLARMARFAAAVHAHWPISGREYMPPPSTGAALAPLDDALIVAPPPGMEVGFVPIVTRQYFPPSP